MGTIVNGANTPLNQTRGTVPDVSGALKDYFQLMVFKPLVKTVSGFQAVETAMPVSFWGTIQPFSARQLMLKPEGQRAWSWWLVHAEPGVVLEVDDVVSYLSKQYRVMARNDQSLYGYLEFHLVQDYTGSGPS